MRNYNNILPQQVKIPEDIFTDVGISINSIWAGGSMHYNARYSWLIIAYNPNDKSELLEFSFLLETKGLDLNEYSNELIFECSDLAAFVQACANSHYDPMYQILPWIKKDVIKTIKERWGSCLLYDLQAGRLALVGQEKVLNPFYKHGKDHFREYFTTINPN